MQSWSWNYLQSCTATVLVRLQEGVVRPGWTWNYTQLEVSGKFDFLLNNPLLLPTSWKLLWHCLNRWLILFLYFQHLNWSSYYTAHHFTLERFDDFVFENYLLSLAWSPTGAKWRPWKSTQRLQRILLRATKAVNFIWIIRYTHCSTSHYTWKANTKRMPLKFVCHYHIITVWDTTKGHEAAQFLFNIGER